MAETERDEPGVKILIVSSRYYAAIAAELEAGVAETLEAAGAEWELLEAPGAFELPAAIGHAAPSGEFDGFVALGCVIRGETSHYDLICEAVAKGLMDLSLTGIPLAFGVLTCETEAQAVVRASRTGKNKGREVAEAVLRMVAIAREFSDESV
ncbi:6,7-dimethyl-8-ribityllumazine synthase [bacterium]|nr:6,7-dimethyl-8-ribityllumazine synthase [bacterium]